MRKRRLLFIPFIQLCSPGRSIERSAYLQHSPLLSLAVVYFCMYRSILFRGAMVLLMALCFWGTMLGANRLLLVYLFGIYALAFIIYKRSALILLGLSVVVCGILLINSSPDLIL